MIEAASRLLATYLANALWQIPMLLGIASLCVCLLRRTSWACQHMLWVGALVLSTLLPMWGLRIPVSHRDAVPSAQTRDAIGTSANVAVGDSYLDKESLFHTWGRNERIRLNATIFWALIGSYSLFVLYRMIVFGVAWRRAQNLLTTAHCDSVPNSLTEVAERCASAWSIKNAHVFCSSEISGFITFGFRRPVLILPEKCLGCVSEADFASVIYHELAHIRRCDYLLNLVYYLLYLPISFHPAAALIKTRIDQTRELTCDEMAAEKSSSRAAYAQSLLNIAQSICPTSLGRSSHALGLFQTDALEQRVLNMLRPAGAVGVIWDRVSALFSAGLLGGTCLALSFFSLQIAKPTTLPEDLDRFQGTWEGQLQGRAFVVLRLQEQDGKLIGTFTHTTRVDEAPNGELDRGDANSADDKVLQARMTGAKLVLTIADHGKQEPPVQYMLERTRSHHEGELHLINPVSEGSPSTSLKIWQTSTNAGRRLFAQARIRPAIEEAP
jgi:beta-lactamase regulating signal transducer with metallopeptidase domain